MVPVLVAAVVIGLDQLAKAAIVEWLGPGSPSHRFDLVDGLLAVHYVENTGAAFGVLADRRVVLSVLALVVLVGLVLYYRQLGHGSMAARLGMGLLVGGALGNIIDRVRLGHVVDFIAVGPWPKFNVADSAITAGVLLVAWRAVSGYETGPPGRPAVEQRVSDEDERGGLTTVHETILRQTPGNGRRR